MRSAAAQEVKCGEAETAGFSSRINRGHTVSESPYERSEFTASALAAVVTPANPLTAIFGTTNREWQ